MQEKYLDLAGLLANKFTIPFIAKYCKSQTSGMSLKNIRSIAREHHDLRELEALRHTIIRSLESQNKLSKELHELINKAETKQILDDIYLPYMPKRQSKALQAIQRGLGPLATKLLMSYANSPEELAAKFVNDESGVLNNRMALEGARQILLEKFSEDAIFLNNLRKHFWENAFLSSVNSKARNDKNSSKYKEYANYSKQVKQIPAQKLFEIFEGRADSYLKISVTLANSLDYGVDAICSNFNLDKTQVLASSWLAKVIEDAWNLKLLPKIEADILHTLRDVASSSVDKELANYLRSLFYLQGAGQIVTMGLVPNAKSGVAVAVIDELGRPLENCVIYPFGLQGDWYQALASLAKMAVRFNVSLISIANLAGYRDVERLCRHLAKMYSDLRLSVSIIDAYGLQENHESVESPAIFVARRSQDPLNEFAKIDNKNLGLLQHDFWRDKYQTVFDEVLEDSICTIGIDLNKVSFAVLCKLPGITVDIANKIIEYREKNGKFNARAELKNVSEIDDFIFQQISGFIFVYGGNNILDTLNVHPDSYYIVEKMAKKLAQDLPGLVFNHQLLDKLVPEEYIDTKHDVESIKDIINWLKYKRKDPRGGFKLPKFNPNIVSINDLVKDLELEGIVSKITNFGAFVDVGVFQDGLIHLPSIREKIGTNVKVGKVIKVKVLDVDKSKKRFSLALEDSEKVDAPKVNKVNKRPEIVKNKPTQKSSHVFNTAMADALAKLKNGD